MKKPNCYKCVHRGEIPGNAHSSCNNHKAGAKGNPHGIKSGWFYWPLNFDPVWLLSCEGFSDDKKDKMPTREIDPMAGILSMLR